MFRNVLSRGSKSTLGSRGIQGRKSTFSGPPSLRDPLQVLKFGGSSVGNASAIARVAGLIERHSQESQVVAVVSAMMGVTNKLLSSVDMAQTAVPARGELEQTRDFLWAMHAQAAEELLPSGPQRGRLLELLSDHIHRRLPEKWNLIGQGRASSETLAEIASLGEELTSQMVASCLANGQAVSGADVIRTVSPAVGEGYRLCVLEETAYQANRQLQGVLRSGGTPIVAGFVGRDISSGDIALLGRGGSDFTASLLAYALRADLLTMYKVESDKSSDGTLLNWKGGYVGMCSNGETLPQLSYEQASNWSQVLHPEALWPPQAAGIPVRVANTLEWWLPGSMISEVAYEEQASESATLPVSL